MHPGVVSPYDAENINQILIHPHLLGHILGYSKLTEIHSQWIWHLWGQPEGIHTALQAHRGSFKTTGCNITGSIWWLLFHPEDRIGTVRKSFKVAGETLAAIEKGLKLPEVGALFDTVQPELAPFKILASPFGKVALSCKKIPTNEVSLQAFGVDQLPTGTHLDRIPLDDVVGRQDRYSKAERERTVSACQEILANIIDPGKTVMHMGTPWHPMDAWKLWDKKQSIIETEDTIIDGEEDNPLQAPAKYDDDATGLLSEDQKRRIKRVTSPSLYAANYKLKHMADEDQLFKEPVYGEWDPKIYRVYMHVDAKWEGTHTMGVTFAARRLDGKIQIHGKLYTDSIVRKIGNIMEHAVKFKVRKSWVENNPDKGYTAKLLSRKPAPDRPPIPVKEYHETMNKHNKITSYLLEYWDELVFDPKSDEAYMAQILDYRENQEPDDAPDSLASLLRGAFYPTDPGKGRGNTLNQY